MIAAPVPLFLDGEALVIDKPAGVPVDRPRDGAESVAILAEGLRFGFARAPAAAHRLDRDTSGCLLLARNPKALKRFAAAFADGRVAKTYLAVVEGVPAAEAGEIDLALAKTSTREAGWRIVATPLGKPARTAWRCIAVAGGRALLRLEPATGRTHQLRVHLASGLGLPIVGDPIYGRGGPAGMLLHAAALRLERAGKPPVEARAPLPERFRAAGFGDDAAA